MNKYDGFINSLSSLNKSENTIKAYQGDLKLFFNSGKDIFNFIEMRASVDSPATLARRIASLKAYGEFMVERGLTDKNPYNVKSPKIPTTIPVCVDYDDYQKIHTVSQGRDKIIIEILYSTGIRISELVGLNIQDVDFRECILKIRGKGNKERLVPYSCAELESYCSGRIGASPVFLNCDNSRLSIRGASKVIDALCRKAGLKHFNPHAFRHGFATGMLRSGVDIRVIQEMLGHASLNTTARYAHVDVRMMQEAQRKYLTAL